jgi:hypothetical protein
MLHTDRHSTSKPISHSSPLDDPLQSLYLCGKLVARETPGSTPGAFDTLFDTNAVRELCTEVAAKRLILVQAEILH